VRSSRPPVPARLHPSAGGDARVELLGTEEAVAPGQACVFYAPEASRVLGGGWITAGSTRPLSSAHPSR
jgi:tRNA-uridine 2-sulfurtransferase